MQIAPVDPCLLGKIQLPETKEWGAPTIPAFFSPIHATLVEVEDIHHNTAAPPPGVCYANSGLGSGSVAARISVLNVSRYFVNILKHPTVDYRNSIQRIDAEPQEDETCERSSDADTRGAGRVLTRS